MSAVTGNGLYNFYSNHTWDIAKTLVVLPLATVAICYFQRHWDLDTRANAKGIALAIVVNTVVYCAAHVAIRQYWFNYWEQKNAEINKESADEKAVRENNEKYEQAKVELEKAHLEIRKNQFELENKSKGQATEVEKSKQHLATLEIEYLTVYNRKKDFIEKKICHVFDDEIKDQQITKGLKERLEKDDVNISDIQTHLEKCLEEVKHKIFGIKKIHNELSDTINPKEAEINQLKNNLQIQKKDFEKNTREKNSEGDYKNQLRADLVKKTTRLEVLGINKTGTDPQHAKTLYEKDDIACNKTEEEIRRLRGGHVDPNLSSQVTADNISLELASLDELFGLSISVQNQEVKAREKTKEAKDSLDDTTKEMRFALEDHRKFIYRVLLFWKNGYEKRKKEWSDKKTRALDSINREDSLLDLVGKYREKDPFKKQILRASIEKYFDSIEKQFESCRLQSEELIIEKDAGSLNFTLDVPDWVEENDALNKKIDEIHGKINQIKNLDKLLPYINKLYSCLEKPNFKYEEIASIFLDFSSIYIHHDGLRNLYLKFKRETEDYLISFDAQEEITIKLSKVKAKHLTRQRDVVKLETFLTELDQSRETSKKRYDNQEGKYLENCAEYNSVQKQIIDIQANQKRLVEQSGVIDTMITSNLAEIKRIQGKIGNKEFQLDTDNATIKNYVAELAELNNKDAGLVKLTSSIGQLSLLDQLKSIQEDLSRAVSLVKGAKENIEKTQGALSTNTKDLRKRIETCKADRETKKTELQDCQTDRTGSIKKVLEIELNLARYEKYRRTMEKCKEAKNFYHQKQKSPNRIPEDALTMLTVQNHIDRVIQAKMDFALKKRAINIERNRLGDLPYAGKTLKTDDYKCRLLNVQLIRYKIDQTWRYSIDVDGEKYRTQVISSLFEEEKAIHEFFLSKIDRLSVNADERTKIPKCVVKALIAIIDLALTKMYVATIRHKDKKPLDYLNILANLKNTLELSKYIEELYKKANLNKDAAMILLSGLDSDIKPYQDNKATYDKDRKANEGLLETLKAPISPYFCQNLNLVTEKLPNINRYIVPLISAKLELVKQLNKKPYKDDPIFTEKTEEYQNQLSKYRKLKYELKETIEALEAKRVSEKVLFKDYDRAQRNAKQAEFSKRQMIEKISYFLPAGILYFVYYWEMINISRMFMISGEAGITTWKIMTAVHYCLQCAFPTNSAVVKERNRKIANKEISYTAPVVPA